MRKKVEVAFNSVAKNIAKKPFKVLNNVSDSVQILQLHF